MVPPGPAGRGAALRESMKQMLQKKKEDGGEKKLKEAAAVGSSSSTSTADMSDPWPEMPLSATTLGVKEGQSHAAELQRRGDFASVAKMWAKVQFIGRFCRPPVSELELVEFALEQVKALLNADDFTEADVVAGRVLETKEALSDVRLSVRARWFRIQARMELRDLEGARADFAEAQNSIASSDPDEAFPDFEEVQQVELKLQQLEASPPAPAAAPPAASGQSGAFEPPERPVVPAPKKATAAPRTAACVLPSATTPHTEPVSGDSGQEDNAVSMNQEFFSRMEQQYEADCAADGWDEVRQRHEELQSSLNIHYARDEIPTDSDYFKVRVPAGRDRELRPTNIMPQRLPSPPRRDFSELRRVEEATREAIAALEAEKARLATAPTSKPIRTKSETVQIDSMSDSSDEEEHRARMDQERARIISQFLQERDDHRLRMKELQ